MKERYITSVISFGGLLLPGLQRNQRHRPPHQAQSHPVEMTKVNTAVESSSRVMLTPYFLSYKHSSQGDTVSLLRLWQACLQWGWATWVQASLRELDSV